LAKSASLKIRKKIEKQEKKKKKKSAIAVLQSRLLKDKDHLKPQLINGAIDVKLRKIATKGGWFGLVLFGFFFFFLRSPIFFVCLFSWKTVVQLFNAIGAQQKLSKPEGEEDEDDDEMLDKSDPKLTKKKFFELLKQRKGTESKQNKRSSQNDDDDDEDE
jgi:hypothetical protein